MPLPVAPVRAQSVPPTVHAITFSTGYRLWVDGGGGEATMYDKMKTPQT